MQRIVPDRATVDALYISDENPPAEPDTDGDHIPDSAELLIGSSPEIPDSVIDSNQDGYLNIEEYLNTLSNQNQSI